MPLETGEFISDLNPVNPVGATDFKSQGDDHLRLLKKTVQQSFPNIDAAVTLTPTELNALTDASLKAANETIGGDKTFTGANVYNGIAASELLDKSADESIGGTYTFTQRIKFPGAANLGILTDETSTGVGSVSIQAGAGSAQFGGSIRLQAHLNAINGGGVEIGLSSASVGKFLVKNSGFSGGTDLLSLDNNGDLVLLGGINAVSYDGVAAANLLDKTAAETITANWEHTQDLVMANNRFFNGKEAGGVQRNLLGLHSSDVILVGSSSVPMTLRALAPISMEIAGGRAIHVVARASGSMLVDDRGSVQKIAGFRNPTWTTQAGAFSVTQAMEGTIQKMTGATQAVTLDTLEAFTTLRLVKSTSSNGSIIKGTLTTLALLTPGAGEQVVTSITIAPGGTAEIGYDSTTKAYVFGSGLTGVP